MWPDHFFTMAMWSLWAEPDPHGWRPSHMCSQVSSLSSPSSRTGIQATFKSSSIRALQSLLIWIPPGTSDQQRPAETRHQQRPETTYVFKESDSEFMFRLDDVRLPVVCLFCLSDWTSSCPPSSLTDCICSVTGLINEPLCVWLEDIRSAASFILLLLSSIYCCINSSSSSSSICKHGTVTRWWHHQLHWRLITVNQQDVILNKTYLSWSTTLIHILFQVELLPW